MKDAYRIPLLVMVLVLIAGALYLLNDSQTGIAGDAEIQTMEVAEKEGTFPKAREIVAPAGFINSPHGTDVPFTISELIGKKVVLVDFWTYSCINCQRTQPYLNAWYEKYRDVGLEIVGVHSPEFDFEKDYTNVARAVSDESIMYPVVLDNDYGTWAAYQNRYWPRKYLIDIDGYIVYDHIGEGGYEETEAVIQALLAERNERLGTTDPVPGGVVSVESTAVTDGKARTPETYFGASRNSEYLGNGKGGVVGLQAFTLPERRTTNKTYLQGSWDIQPEYARGEAGSSIHLKVQAKDVYFVASSEKGAKIRILWDGKSFNAGSGAYGGRDVHNGLVEVQDEKLYYLIEGPEWGEHDLEIIIEEGVLDAFTFTFG